MTTMPRKVLISFLGTNDYFPVFYTWGKNQEKTTNHRTKFIQESLVTELCKDKWTADDCIMIFRTPESDAINWKDTKDEETGKETTGLLTTLQNIPGLKCKINPSTPSSVDNYLIPVGFSEEEMWKIFKTVFEQLNPDDEVYFDVTHAFRTIPMFATVLLNYARFLKNTDVKGVYYGAFEILGPLYKVKALPKEQQEELTVPIVDLTNIVRLQEINTAAASFRDFGNLSAFSGILFDTGISELDECIENISFALEDLDFYIQTCRIKPIYKGEYMITITDEIKMFCESRFTNEAQRTLLLEISAQLQRSGFVAKPSYQNVRAAINWAIKHKMIQQAYTMAKEYIISMAYDLLEEYDLKEAFINELRGNGEIRDNTSSRIEYKIRESLGSILLADKKITGTGYIFEKSKKWRQSNVAKELINKDEFFYFITKPYQGISDRRNNLNHASTSGAPIDSFGDYQNEFNKLWTDCLTVLI